MNPTKSWKDLEAERRSSVERKQRNLDLEDEYERNRAAAATVEEERQIKTELNEARRAYRLEDVELGKRSPGTGINLEQFMWARWLEIAVRHELDARQAFFDLVDGAHNSMNLGREFAASLVAVTASAYTVEAVYADVVYLIPEHRSRGKRHKDLRRVFRVAFGIPEEEVERVAPELVWLFDLRDQAAHPYAESLPAAPHPAGLNSGVENALFKAVESARAVDVAMTVLRFAGAPPQPSNRWVERWVNVRAAAYHVRVVEPLSVMRAAVPRPEPRRSVSGSSGSEPGPGSPPGRATTGSGGSSLSGRSSLREVLSDSDTPTRAMFEPIRDHRQPPGTLSGTLFLLSGRYSRVQSGGVRWGSDQPRTLAMPTRTMQTRGPPWRVVEGA